MPQPIYGQIRGGAGRKSPEQRRAYELLNDAIAQVRADGGVFGLARTSKDALAEMRRVSLHTADESGAAGVLVIGDVSPWGTPHLILTWPALRDAPPERVCAVAAALYTTFAALRQAHRDSAIVATLEPDGGAVVFAGQASRRVFRRRVVIRSASHRKAS